MPSSDQADTGRVTRSEGGGKFLPWVLDPAIPAAAATTGDNARDNVEQVVIYDAPAGSYVIEISHKGALQGGASQDYGLVISVGPGEPVSQGLVIDEEFSGGLPAGWAIDTVGSIAWQFINQVDGSPNPTGATGGYAMVENANQFVETSLRTHSVDLSSATAAVLRFNSFFYYDTFETINVDVSLDGGSSWPTVWSHNGFSNTPKLHTLDLSGTIAGEASVMLRFRFQSSIFFPDGRYWQIDNIELEAFGSGTGGAVEPPGQAGNPNPSNGSIDIAVDALLSWTPGALADSHDIYFHTDSGFSGVSPINEASTSFNPGPLLHATTYYWRIDSVNSDGVTPGATWSFTTVAPGC